MSAIELFQHRWVPPAEPGAATLLLLHGTGGDESDLLPIADTVARELGRLSPRGRSLDEGATRFFRRLRPGVFDLDDLHAKTAELADFVTEAGERYGFDRGRVVALGFSNGANIAASLLLSRPGLLAGAALLRPMVPYVPDPLPDLGGVPALLLAGELDTMVPPAETERLAELLKRAGAAPEVRWQRTGHGLTQNDLADLRKWLGDSGFVL